MDAAANGGGSVITLDSLTKDYGHGRGCFNVSFDIKEGEVFGFLGPNGAGKTTAIRHILGFIKPQSGGVSVLSTPVWGNAHKLNSQIGYIPGEINFPEKMTAMELVRWMAQLKGTKSLNRAKMLFDFFELNAGGEIKRMSKGMKQKVGIVCALMHDSQILVLDEPTSGLDPLMQEKFVELIRREKAAGKTVLMSSHMFAEVEKTCDRAAIIKQGKIVAEVDMDDIKKAKTKTFKVKFENNGASAAFAKQFAKFTFTEINNEKNRIRVAVNDSDINGFLAAVSSFPIKYISEIKLTLEDYFMKFYSSAAVQER